MARRFGLPALLLVLALAFGGCASTREFDLGYEAGSTEDDLYYYDDLASYGAWVDVPRYGTVWCPDVSTAWQPYTVGSWAYTDDGWFWVSEDPWGSVPYHYGRWAYDYDYGWVWVPGDVWAPSWVAWRYGSGWVGWAPLPPDVVWHVHVGIDPYDLDRHLDHRYWSFTRAEDFGTHRERVRVEPYDKNQRLLKETRNVTKYAARSRPVETGMNPALLAEHREKIERYQVVDSSKPVPKSGVRVRGKRLEVYRPAMNVKAPIRERVRTVQPQTREKPASPSRESAVREREKPEVRVAQREEVARVTPRSPQIETREQPRARVESGARQRDEARREELARQRDEARREEMARKREEARQQENAIQQRAEAARQREKSESRREEAVRQREEAVRQREEAARERQEAARHREEARKEREQNTRGQKSEAPAREREVRERESRERTSDSEMDSKRERVAKR